jgi:hypothetical protein
MSTIIARPGRRGSLASRPAACESRSRLAEPGIVPTQEVPAVRALGRQLLLAASMMALLTVAVRAQGDLGRQLGSGHLRDLRALLALAQHRSLEAR